MPNILISRIGRFVAYGFGQAIGYGIDISIFSLLVVFAHLQSPIIAHLCGKFGSATLTFFYHSRFSFPGEKANTRLTSTIAYTAMVFINVALTSIVLKVLLLLLPSFVFAAKLMSDILGVCVTYVFMNSLVFPRTAP